MITDVNDLEQLLTKYESERVLVGPLLSLPISASYRYFHLAGKGNKIYQSIGLGFLENDSHAQKQRADIIEKLKSRFAELESFDSHNEMARAVHRRWQTEETVRALAAAEREAKASLAPQLAYETTDERTDEHTLRSEQSERSAARRLPESHQGTQPLKQTGPIDGASLSEERRPITVNQGTQLAGGPATVPELSKVAGHQSPNDGTYPKAVTSADRFRKLAGTLLNGNPDRPNQADEPAPSGMKAGLRGTAGLSSNHEPKAEAACRLDAAETACRLDANDGGPSKHHNNVMGNFRRELFEHPARDEAESIGLPLAPVLPPIAKELGEAPPKQTHRDLGLTQDDIASAILKVALRARPAICPVPSAEASRGHPERPALSAAAADPIPSHPSSVPALAVEHTRGRSIILSFAAVIAAAMIAWILVLPSTSRDVNEVSNAMTAEVASLSAKSAAGVPLLPLGQSAHASGPGQQIEAPPRTVPPPLAPLRAANSDAGAAVASDQHKPVAQQAGAGDRSEVKEIANPVGRGTEIKSSADVHQATHVATLESGVAPISGPKVPAQGESTIQLGPDEIAILLSRAKDLLKSGDFASARLSLRRAAEAGNAEAALALGSTYDPAVLRQLGPGAIAVDVEQARHWYGKAVDFGSAAAAERLTRLPQPKR